MRSKRFSEEQINAVLKESEAGAETNDLGRGHGIQEPALPRYAVTLSVSDTVTVIVGHRPGKVEAIRRLKECFARTKVSSER